MLYESTHQNSDNSDFLRKFKYLIQLHADKIYGGKYQILKGQLTG